MNKRLFSLILCLVFVFTSIVASAAVFPDVSETKYSWAYKQIEEMASKKIIAGFEDSTFRPENAVTRVDALLLVSRIAGASESSLSEFVDAAYDANYANVNVLGYSAYERNLAYLTYKGIYTAAELKNFVGNKLGSNALKRYEAAILLTKIAGGEATAKANTMPILSYEDSSKIPATAKSYVEFCETTGLMQGMEDNKFNPNYEVTRAQMAVMLYRAMEYLETTHSTGTVTEVNNITNSITYSDANGISKTVNILSDTPLRIDGDIASNANNVAPGYKINVVSSKGNVTLVEFLTRVPDENITGIYAGNVSSSTTKKITVKSPDGSSSQVVGLSDDCDITINGVSSTLAQLPKDCYVEVTVKNGKGVSLVAENKTKTVSGIIKSFSYGDPSQITITLSNNTLESYDMAKSVDVKRNGNKATAADLMVGDRVNITLTYNQISAVTATSATKTVEGTIKEIVISANPTMTIATSSGDLECALTTSGLEVTVNGEASDVYGLRLGYVAKVKMESTTITKIEVSSVATPDTLNVVGVVEYVDTNYYLIQVTETSTGQSRQVFVKKNATIIDGETQKSKTLGSIKEGSLITAVITSNGFTSEAISIVILPKE